MHFSLLFLTFYCANLGRERFSFIKIASDAGWKISNGDYQILPRASMISFVEAEDWKKEFSN